ncbi:MAG: sugar ABC transporter permease, partial [Anaerolineae bacterium]|nr:sugar ABC transporter permease [Anaerolineae bacterium]
MVSTKRAQWHHLLVFIGPAVVIYTLFMAYPLVDSLRLSLYTREGSEIHYVGLQNFDRLFNESIYSDRLWDAIQHNFKWFILFMLIQNPVGLLLATLVVSPKLKGRNFYRTIIYVPTTMSIVIIGWIWTLMLNPLWGIVNDALKSGGLGSI